MTESLYTDQVLTGLKILGMIREGQKVCIRNGLINIEGQSQGVWAALSRWIHGDNRTITMSYIRNIVHNALEIRRTHPHLWKDVDEGLSHALNGITALEVTYTEDAGVVAALEVLKEKINGSLSDGK
jgi:hypothetical protein